VKILVSGLREYLAALKVSVPVTWIAKWKTALQMVALGFPARRPRGRQGAALHDPDRNWLLWVAAVITIYTGYDYFRAGLRHVVDE
jgi:cardiolipin synthase